MLMPQKIEEKRRGRAMTASENRGEKAFKRKMPPQKIEEKRPDYVGISSENRGEKARDKD